MPALFTLPSAPCTGYGQQRLSFSGPPFFFHLLPFLFFSLLMIYLTLIYFMFTLFLPLLPTFLLLTSFSHDSVLWIQAPAGLLIPILLFLLPSPYKYLFFLLHCLCFVSFYLIFLLYLLYFLRPMLIFFRISICYLRTALCRVVGSYYWSAPSLHWSLASQPYICTIFPHLASSTTLKMEAARSSKMLVPIYQTTWHHIPEDPNHNIHSHENIKSYINN
jgi:hypothetical protein